MVIFKYTLNLSVSTICRFGLHGHNISNLMAKKQDLLLIQQYLFVPLWYLFNKLFCNVNVHVLHVCWVGSLGVPLAGYYPIVKTSTANKYKILFSVNSTYIFFIISLSQIHICSLGDGVFCMFPFHKPKNLNITAKKQIPAWSLYLWN